MHRAKFKSYESVEHILHNDVLQASAIPKTELTPECFAYATTDEMVEVLGNKSMTSSFLLACKMGSTNMVSSMLQMGVDPTIESFAGLIFASEQGHDSVVKLLLQHVDMKDFQVEIEDSLDAALQYSRLECVDLLKPLLL